VNSNFCGGYCSYFAGVWIQDQGHPDGLTAFMITVEGQAPAPFDPSAAQPNITVHEGDVEDRVLETGRASRTRFIYTRFTSC
jgi:hypothetical protein